MTLKKQLLLLLLIHLFAALAAWDGYRIGLRRGRAEGGPQIYIQTHPNTWTQEPEPPALPPERTDANWRGN